MATAHKSATRAKGKPRGKPFTGPDDPRRHKTGAPKRGESWGEIISAIGDMTGPEVSAFAGTLGKQFAKLPNDVTLKNLVVLRVFGALLNDPQPGLLNSFMERVEGKVKDKVEHSGEVTVIRVGLTGDAE